MSNAELQEEEVEVLQSIYDGDENFKEVSTTCFQYKIGEDQHYKSFLVEVSWGESYPEEMPTINMGTFYNKHILDDVKSDIIEKLKEECENLLGTAMTYSLFEYCKDNADSLMENQPEAMQSTREESTPAEQQEKKIKEKKEQLTKAQKRKMINRTNNQGELPRGWNWVDVIKHLSQTGGKPAES